jgi:ABC-type bacteriocin/lantibiotic exporter with double-glycine peptidase domain
VHPAYTALREKSTRNFIRASIIVIAVLILDILLLRNSWVLPLVVAGYAAVMAITLADSIKATRKFKRAWNGQNPEGIQLNT